MPQTPPIVVISERLGPIGPEELRIQASGAILRTAPLWDMAQVRANASDAHVVLLGAVEPFDRTVLDELPGVVAIVRRGVGHDNVDVEAATALGILVAIVPDASVEEVSDHALALLVSIERRVVELDVTVHGGGWGRDPTSIQAARAGARRMADLTLGVVGFGRIGQALARKARPLYARILAFDPATDAVPGGHPVDRVSLEELLSAADHLSFHVPLTPHTRNMVDAPMLARLRPGAVVVNTSRGGIIDEAALVAALESGSLSGAGLDVTTHEPLEMGDPLLQAPRTILTAHSASWSTTSRAELQRRSVDAVLDVLGGKAPSVLADEAVLSSPRLRLTGVRAYGRQA